MKYFNLFLTLCILTFSIIGKVNAQVPNKISYQGLLTNPDGSVIPDGNYNLTFKIYNISSGGTALWTETQNVTVSKGTFSVILGEANPLNLQFNEQYWLGVTLEGSSEFTPRSKLASSPYSIRSLKADSLKLPFSGSTSTIVGAFLVTNTSSGYAIEGNNTGSGIGVVGNSANNIGVSGSTSASGSYGVRGFHNPTGNYGYLGSNLYGVYGESPNGIAVYGKNTGTTGNAIKGEITNAGSNIPTIYGKTTGSGAGVLGESDKGDGVYGKSNISGGVGVHGEAFGNQLNTQAKGVYGYADGDRGYGVYGKNADGSYGFLAGMETGWPLRYNYGVGGRINQPVGSAVLGENYHNSTGAYLGSGSGIYAYSDDTSRYAGYFDGKVKVDGNFTVTGTKAFIIDHPLDPANKYLIHFCVESNDVLNIYNGNVITDANGEATVTLPSYFESLNRDFRYQLTVVGQFAQAIVSQEIQNNRFTIKTDKPNVKVSWQVTGIRNDPYLKVHPAQVEVEKTGKEKGRYIHPKEYGVSETFGINYEEQKMREERLEKERAEQERINPEQQEK